MANIRFYELARDLNMTNKALLDKLQDLEISVKSHMSSLDEATVERIRGHILGKTTDTVEITRVKPTVIRRRKKVVQEEPEAAVSAPAAEAAPETAEEPVPPAKPETPAAEVPTQPVMAAEAQPAAPTPAEEPAQVAKVPDPEEVAASEPPAPTAEPTVSEEVPSATPPSAEVAKKPAAPKTKKRKETPAKIIKLGEVPRVKPSTEVVPATEKAAPGTKAVSAKKAGLKGKTQPKELPEKDHFKKKAVGAPGDESNRRFFKKKITFKKKEVIEGADLYSRAERVRKGRRGAKGKVSVAAQKPQITIAKAIKRRIRIDDAIILSELAKRMGVKAGDMIRKLMDLGVMVTVNQTIDFDTAVLVASEFNYEVERASFEEESFLKIEADDPGKLKIRPPVVTIMGHVDHGKTSLLDVIRKTKVTEMEAGGITQHIGAYNVELESGQIVFLDTPGHEAFTAMRSRGAQITDLVVLVVAADDGVMPQTIEAINHAKAAGVPIIVAVNKIDKANADLERVKRELTDQGLMPEEWGGDTIFLSVSAKQKTGINELLEMILLQAEVLELKANFEKLARGHVVEAKLDTGRGPVATVLVQEGTLRAGDPIVCGVHHGKVRAMLNDRGAVVDHAGPSSPVEVLGLSGVPMAGDEFIVLADEKDARQVSAHRMQQHRAKELAKTNRLSLEGLFEKMQEGEVKDLNLIIKADVHGSIEALRDSLTKLSNPEVKIGVIHSATGTVTESDVSLAAVSNAIILGFNVRPSAKVLEMANEEHVDMRFYNIIYNAIKDIQDAIVGMMASTFEEKLLGRAEVRQVFQVPKLGAVAGCYVTDGKVERGRLVRLVRDGVVLYDGKIGSLRRFKDDVREVQTGYECGIGIEKYNDIKTGDVMECYFLEEIRPKVQA